MRGIGHGRATAIGATAELCAGSGFRQFDFWLGDWVVENRQRKRG